MDKIGTQNENEQFVSLWASALEKYERRTGRNLRLDLNAQSIKTLEDLRNKISESNSKFSSFRERRSGLWKTLLIVCTPIQVIGGLTQSVLAATPMMPACAAFGAIFHLIQSAKGVSEAYDAVEELLARIGAATLRFQQYSQGNVDENLGLLVTETMCKILEILARAEKLANRSRPQEYLRVAFLGTDEKLNSLLKDLERLSEEEARLVLALINSSTQRMERGIEDLGEKINQSRIENMPIIDQRQMDAVLHASLSDRMYEIYRSIDQNKIHATGEWIFKDSLMQNWLERKSTILWILGVGGIGKSFLSASVISELEKRNVPSQSVAYFYIKNDNESTRSVNNLLKCIASQLASDNSEYRAFATVVCRNERRLRAAEDTWEKLFRDYFSVHRYRGSAKVIIDGIDEAPLEQQELLFRFMKMLCAWKIQNACRLQFLLLGRPEIIGQWEGVSPAYIEVSPAKMSADVEKYVIKNIGKVKVLRSRDISREKRVALKRMIITKLQRRASGMFLWVKLLLEEIMNQTRPSGIEQILDSPPKIFQLLETIIERLIKEQTGRKNDLKEILIWSTFAPRELYLGEIKLLLELREPVGEGLPDLELYLREDYRSLFVLDRQDGKTTEDLRRLAALEYAIDKSDDLEDMWDEDIDGNLNIPNEKPINGHVLDSDLWTTKVRINHSIIREFISKGHLKNNPVIAINPNEAHLHIALTCLRNLAGDSPSKNERLPDESRIQKYCASNFIFHIMQLNPLEMSKVDIETVASLVYFNLYNKEPLAQIIKSKENSDEFLATFFADEVLSKIQQWVTRAPTGELNPAAMEWHSLSQSSKISVLQPMAESIAEIWLQEMTSGLGRLYLNFFVIFLHAYQRLVSQTSLAKETESFFETVSVFEVDRFHHNEICMVAERTKLPQNSLWYSNLGLTLCWNNHDHEAVRFFEKAINLEKKNPTAYYGLCNTYLGVGEYVKSIEMGIACISSEPTESILGPDAWYFMKKAAQKIGQDDMSILDWARGNLREHGESLQGTTFIVETLTIQKRFDEVLNFLEKLGGNDTNPKKNRLYLLLPDLSEEFFSNVAFSVAMTYRRSFALKMADNLIEIAKTGNDSREMQIGKYFKGLIHFSARQKLEASMELFEDIRSDLENSDSSLREQSFLYTMDRKLGSHYFERAMMAKRSGDEKATIWAEKLEELDQNPSFSPISQYPSTTERETNSAVTQTLALWHRLEGARELCRKLLIENFRKGVQILRDNDIQNDAEGYEILARVLFKAGNIKQAIAALTPLLGPFSRQQARYNSLKRRSISKLAKSSQKSLEEGMVAQEAPEEGHLGKSMASLSTDQSNNKDMETRYQAKEVPSPGSAQFIIGKKSHYGVPPIEHIDDDVVSIGCCFGCRGQEIEKLWICEYCEPFSYKCERCLREFQNPSIRFVGMIKCHGYHPHHRVYPIDESLKHRATEEVQGRTLPRKEWLNALEVEWMPSNGKNR